MIIMQYLRKYFPIEIKRASRKSFNVIWFGHLLNINFQDDFN